MINPKIESIINNEEKILKEIVSSLKKQLASYYQRFTDESTKARELTSEIVASTKDEQMQQLANDEAVSHRLADNMKKEVKKIDTLIDKPYFARIVLEEIKGDKTREIEYKLGTTSNLDCRIIDWRNAPIAKLFYQYEQGDEYFEVIQDQEKEGLVKLRNQVGIKNSELQSIDCNEGRFEKKDEKWTISNKQLKSSSSLKPILELITPDQFQLITESSETAVLIQGIAGSGKTTIALHRLAWLMHKGNSELSAEDALVIVVSNSLQTYISSILPELGSENVKIKTFEDWARETLAKCLNQAVEKTLIKKAAPSILRLKKSTGFLEIFQKACKNSTNYKEALFLALNQEKEIIEKEKLIDREIIEKTKSWSLECLDAGYFDSGDLSLALLFELSKDQKLFKEKYGTEYLVADEIQDLSSSEILLIVSLVKKSSNVTLVGDTAQQLTKQSDFQGWDSLKQLISSKDGELNFTTLNLSHRSTVEIMRVADAVLGENRSLKGRSGRAPIWFKCYNENTGVKQSINWIRKVKEKFPEQNLAVLCKDDNEAKLVASLLEPSFGGAVNLFSKYERVGKVSGIQVAPIEASKGLEFFAVLIWNPTERDYPKSEASKKALYTAITRSSELVCFTTWGRYSPLLHQVPSRYLRIYKAGREE